MPSKSPKQRRFMAAAANNPAFAKKAGISQSVAQEFHAADTRRPTLKNPQAEKEAKRGNVSMADIMGVGRKADRLLRQAGLKS